MDESMSAPQRLQRSRKKGARLPPGTVCVTRGTRWGNPYRVSDYMVTAHRCQRTAAGMAARDFMEALWCGKLRITPADVRLELRGKVLACYCALDMPCHADTLIEVANSEPGSTWTEQLSAVMRRR